MSVDPRRLGSTMSLPFPVPSDRLPGGSRPGDARTTPALGSPGGGGHDRPSDEELEARRAAKADARQLRGSRTGSTT